LPWEGRPLATIPSHELSAPSFAGILSLKEMDSTTVYIFCRESILQLYLILPAELKKTMHESIAAARVRSLRLHLFGLIYPWRRGGSTRGTRCPKHASKPNEKNSVFLGPDRWWDDSGDGCVQARIDISAINRRKM
jgi:hypothetical protein